MVEMELGSPVYSPARMQLTNLAVFSAWESEAAIDDFLASSQLGQRLASGWHLRMNFLRRWGSVKELADLPEEASPSDPEETVAAFTLARLKLPEVPRFIRWGKPVERLVRDHPASIFSTASIRLPRTVSTFSIWRTQREMAEMVHGHSPIKNPERHAKAMKERSRKDFHFEFTTLRFRPISEHGSWQGRSNFTTNFS